MSTENQPQLFVIGALHVDELALSSTELLLGESNTIRWERRAGGVAANVARAAADNPALAVTLLANLGADGDGKQLQAALTQAGVSVISAGQKNMGTGRYSAILQPDGEVLIGLADVAQAETLNLALINSCLDLSTVDSVLIDGNLSAATLRELANHLKSQQDSSTHVIGIAVSPVKVTRMVECLAHLDLLFCNFEEAQALSQALPLGKAATPQALLMGLCAQGCDYIVMTQADKGVHIASSTDYTYLPVQPLSGIQTANGPGDALAGATAAHLCNSELNHAAVTRAVQGMGLPAAQQVLLGKKAAPLLQAQT